MDENKISLQTNNKTENSCLIQQLSDDFQQIVIDQIGYQYGLAIGSDSGNSMISSSYNNDFKVTINDLNEECELKNIHCTSKDTVGTNLSMLLDSEETTVNQNVMERFIDLPSKSKNQVDAKALKNVSWLEANNQNLHIQSCYTQSTDEDQKRSYQSYSNLINRYCSKCKIVSKNVNDCECYNCKSSLQFQCKKCSNLYKNYIALLNHIKYECYKLPTFYCPICNYTTYRKISLLNHTQVEHPLLNESEDSHQCLTCKKKFKEQTSMLRHEKICVNKPNLICEYCPYRTKLHQLLIYHMQKKHQQCITNKYKCPDCSKKYRDLKTLHLHMKFTCSVKKYFQCDYCHFKTDKQFALAKHVQEVHRLFYQRISFLNK